MDTLFDAGYTVGMNYNRKQRRGRPTLNPKNRLIRRCIRVSDSDYDRWERAANRKGSDLSKWIRESCEMRMK